jgi:hypothetical protein
MADDELSPAEPVEVVSSGDRAIAEALTSVSRSMSAFAEQLARTQPAVDKIERRSWWQIIGLSVLSMLTIAVVLLALNTRSLTGVVQDCIDPTGQCYQQSRARTGEIQRSIVDAQHQDMLRNLGAVCSIIVQHGLAVPPECAAVSLPPAGTSTTTRR